MEVKRGKLIVLEGTDCSGKGTQTQMLIDRLTREGIGSQQISFPRYETPTGEMIARYLGRDGREPEFGWANAVDPKFASYLYAVDRFCASPQMEALLTQGINLISNRYVESNMGHQGGKFQREPRDHYRKKFFQWLDELEYGLFKLPRPDGIIFLYMPYKRGMELKKGRPGIPDAHENDPNHLMHAEEAYLDLAEMYRWTKIICDPNPTDPSPRNPQEIHEEVFQKVLDLVKK